ncbi:MAG: SDR family oxidoreductase [Desulfobacterales bacterium]|nr:SDR family oxidoreductase [Desulfobacterales bacterium]
MNTAVFSRSPVLSLRPFLHEAAQGPCALFFRKFPDNVLLVAGDVTQSADLHRLVDAAVTRFGKVDVVVPNAGIAKVVQFADCTEEVIQHQFSVNFMGATQTVRAFLPHINEGGVILFITTFLTQVGPWFVRLQCQQGSVEVPGSDPGC